MIHRTLNSACCSLAIQTTDPERDRLVQGQSVGDLAPSRSGFLALAQEHTSTPAVGFACDGVHSSLHRPYLAPAPWRRCTSLLLKILLPGILVNCTDPEENSFFLWNSLKAFEDLLRPATFSHIQTDWNIYKKSNCSPFLMKFKPSSSKVEFGYRVESVCEEESLCLTFLTWGITVSFLTDLAAITTQGWVRLGGCPFNEDRTHF